MTKWSTRNKEKYSSLGYTYTGIGSELYIKVKDLNIDSNIKVVVCCDDCGEEIITPYRNYNRIVGKSGSYRCRKCNAPYTSNTRIQNNILPKLEKFNKLIESHGYKSIATEDHYQGSRVPMPFICPKHGIQKISLNSLQQGNICPECGKENKRLFNVLSSDEVVQIISSKNNDIVLNPDEYINYKTNNLNIKCGSCGNIFTTSLASIMNGQGYCKECGVKYGTEQIKLSYNEIISRTTFNGVCYLINPEDYVNSTTTNLIFKCVSCENTFKRDLSHYLQGDKRCPKCISRISVGENKIIDVLDERNINYVLQKRFEDCRDKKPLPFDFYLPDYNCCIEFDGYQHYNKINGDTDEKFEKRKHHDNIKTEYCNNNDINLIRIPYWEFKNIEDILAKELCL